MQQVPVVPCGCTSKRECCEQGRQYVIDVWCLYQMINDPSFLRLSYPERDALWNHYYSAVNTYLSHCGYQVES